MILTRREAATRAAPWLDPAPAPAADPLARALADLAAERAAHDVLRSIAAVQGRELDALRARVAELEEALTAPHPPPGKRTR